MTPWGPAAELARALPGTETGTYRSAEVGGLLAAAGARRIVAVVRDVHRHDWMADALDALVAARPDTIVVEMGVPQSPPTGVAARGHARRGPRLRRGRRRGHPRHPLTDPGPAPRRAGGRTPGDRAHTAVTPVPLGRRRSAEAYRPCQAGLAA